MKTGEKLSSSRSKFAEATGKPAFVTGGGVLFDDAPLRGAINQRERCRNCLGGAFHILVLQQTTHGANLMSQAGLANAVDRRFPLSAADALQRRNCICH